MEQNLDYQKLKAYVVNNNITREQLEKVTPDQVKAIVNKTGLSVTFLRNARDYILVQMQHQEWLATGRFIRDNHPDVWDVVKIHWPQIMAEDAGVQP